MNTKSALLRVLNNSSDVEATKWLYEVAVNVGKSYINYRIKSGTLCLKILSCESDYVARTSVAELFARDVDNNFKLLNRNGVFSTIDSENVSEIEILFKRLVITKVKDGIYSLFSQHDLQLNKIIRNYKLAILQSEDVKLTKDGILHLNQNYDSEILPSEILELLVSKVTRECDSIPKILTNLINEVSEYSEYRVLIGLTELAILTRATFTELNLVNPAVDDKPMHLVEESFLINLIDKAVLKVAKRYEEKYVVTDKLSSNLFNNYIKSIRNMYLSKLHNGDAAEKSILYYLQKEIPELSQAEYRTKHRVYLEYLLKLSREQIKTEINFTSH